MPSYKDPISIHLPHCFGGPSPYHEAGDAIIAEEFSPRATAHRRNAYWLDDVFACDDFRMYDYKVRRCMRSKSHDWTNCPFAHQGEKARRRDPRKIHYSAEPCPDLRKGSCGRGDACMYAHGVFECWLHPAKYRTQPCKDGKDCKRKVCFFAHSMQELRHVDVDSEAVVDGAPIFSSGSPSQPSAARQAFLMHQGCGKGGGSILNGSADEVCDMVHSGGYGGTAHGYMNASRRGGLDASGMPKLIGMDQSSYNSCGSYDLSSPTSTLKGPFHISSFLSPPLSPLNTPSSDRSNIFSSRGHGTAVQVDDRIPKADAHILSRHISATDQEFLHANYHIQQVGDGASTFSPRTYRQTKWIPLCNNWNAEGTFKHSKGPDNMWEKVCDRLGEGGSAENATPDIGWVCELVM